MKQDEYKKKGRKRRGNDERWEGERKTQEGRMEVSSKRDEQTETYRYTDTERDKEVCTEKKQVMKLTR